MWAKAAENKTAIAEWHFNILGVDVTADDATVNAAYRVQMLLAHPDRKNAIANALIKTQMLNEEKALLLDPKKRQRFEDGWNSRARGGASRIEEHDIVMLQSFRNHQYNYKFARVVSENLGSMFDTKYTVTTQHSCAQYNTAYASKSATFNVASSAMQVVRLVRVYGEAERHVAEARWSKYYKKDDVVTINSVEEAPWYNGQEARIVGYNEDLMRFDVQHDGKSLAFLPHNLSISRKCIPDAPSEQSE